MTFSQWKQWVVSCGCYHIVGDNLIHNSQETILMPGIVRFMVKIVKQKHEINNIQPLSYVKLPSSDFIEFFNFSSSDDLTPHSSSMILLNLISQFGSL